MQQQANISNAPVSEGTASAQRILSEAPLVHSDELQAMRNRALNCMLFNAEQNDALAFMFWRGQANACSAAIQGFGKHMAERDARLPSGYEPSGYLQAAFAALPANAEALTLAEAQQLLQANGVEVAAEAMTNRYLVHGSQAEHGKVSAVDVQDEHAPARVGFDNSSGQHGASCETAIVGQEGGAT